jgi:hypothetical protein
VTGTSATGTHTVVVIFNVADYQLSGPASITLPPDGQATANLIVAPSAFYNGMVNLSCTTGSLRGQCAVSPNSTGSAIPRAATLPETYTINVVGSPASLSQPKGSPVTLIVP